MPQQFVRNKHVVQLKEAEPTNYTNEYMGKSGHSSVLYSDQESEITRMLERNHTVEKQLSHEEESYLYQ